MLVAARLLTLCALAHAGQDTGATRSLLIGQRIESELGESAQDGGDPAAVVDFRIELLQAQAVTIELRSYAFDAYLVLRNEAGAILAEDDNGLTRSQARLVIDAPTADTVYTLQVRAHDRRHGAFALLMRAGKPTEPTLGETRIAALRDVSQGLQVLEAMHGPVHASLLPLVDELGELQERGGALMDALDTYVHALELRLELLGEDDPATVESMNIVGLVHKDLGNFDQAAEMLEAVLDIRLETLGSGHADTAVSQENLGVLYCALDRLAEAEQLCAQAAHTLEKLGGDEDAETLVARSNLAHALRARGKYEQAQEMFEEILSIRERVLGPEHISTAKTLNNLAALLGERGHYRDGCALQERALRILGHELGPEHPTVAQVLNNLGSLRESAGDSVGARTLFERALEIQQARLGEANYMAATTLQNLAVLLASQGLLEEGLDRMQRSVEMLRQVLPRGHIQIAVALNNLGSIFNDQGAPGPALVALREAMQIAGASEDPGLLRASILTNITTSMRQSGRTAEAVASAREAVELSRVVYGPDHVVTARNMNNLMVQLEGPDRFELGARLLEDALEISDRELEPGHLQRVTIRANLATLHADRGNWHAAWETVASAPFGELRQILATTTEEQSYRLLANRFWQIELEQTYASKTADSAVHTKTYERVLNWKGQIASSMQASRKRLHRSLSAEQREQLETLRGLQGDLSRISFETGLDADERDARITELLERRKRLEIRALSWLDSIGQATVSLSDVRDALPDGAALVDFTLCRGYSPERKLPGGAIQNGSDTEHHVLAWTLGPRAEHPTPIDLGPAREMEIGVQSFLDQMRSGTPRSRDDANARLRAALWDPLAGHLDGADMVFISPDGFLGTVPFEAIGLEDGSFLLEHKAFVYTQNIAGLVNASPRSTLMGGDLLCVGGVDFGRRATPIEAVDTGERQSVAPRSGSSMNAWRDLPHTSDEIHALARLHEELAPNAATCLLLEGSHASEEKIKRELSGKSIVHFATHGFFRPEGVLSIWDVAKAETGTQPLRARPAPTLLAGMHPGLLSGLVCSGANLGPIDDRDDGYLTAEEIGWLDLAGLNLVVLSGCETGLGIARTGEGFIGLRRAFAIAGARTVICSLWSIEDESAHDLMESFYAGLWKHGLGKLEALRAAQLEMLARNRSLRLGPKPETWAAFVLSGDWR
ncbi:MAG: CHAT domain-containing protein/tetratricopeptide (TPR) repeat protein [Chlamydiales bacterium]|jgi:CHAT domain-containing protein/tetratricopeptide (TPR) repeat protein